MAYVYLTCPMCRAKFNADDSLKYVLCPLCSFRLPAKVLTEEELRQMQLNATIKCNRNCEKTGERCRCGCVREAYLEK